MKRSFHLACLVLGLVGVNGYAQDTTSLSLPDLWSEASTHYPGLEAYRSQHREAEINEKVIRFNNVPDVSLQVQQTVATQNAIGGAFFPLPGLYNVNGDGLSIGPANNTFGSVVMDWSFLRFGRQKKSQQAARILTREAQHRVEAENLKIQTELSRAYFRYSFDDRMTTWALLNTRRLETLLAAAVSRADAGLVPGADTLLIKATLDQTRSDLHKWRGQRDESKEVMSQWVNIPATELSVSIAPLVDPEQLRESPPVETETLHPHLAVAGERIRYAAKQQEQVLTQGLPTVSLLGGVQLRGTSAGAENFSLDALQGGYSTRHNYAIGIGLTWNLTSVLESRLEAGRHRERERQMKSLQAEVDLALRSQKTYALQQLAELTRQIRTAEASHNAALQAYALFEARYTSGLISITELLQIEDLVQKTDRARIEAHHQLRLQQVNLAEATANFDWLQKTLE